MSFFTPAPTPPTTDDPTNFDPRADDFVAWMANFATESEAYGAFLAAANMFGIVIPYVFSATTTDADPGAGMLRLGPGASQSVATVIRADLTDNLGGNATALLDMLDDSTSAQKGVVRLMKAGDSRVWIYAYLTAVATPSGYRNITITPISASTTNPFADGDAVILAFVPKGDKGDQGLNAPFVDVFAPYTVTGSPTAVNFNPLPTGYGELNFRFGLTYSTTAGLRVAFSEDGVNFTSAVTICGAAASHAGEVIIRDVGGTMGAIDCSYGISGSLFGASTRDAAMVTNRTQGFIILPSRLTHVRFSPSTGNISSGGFDQPRAR